MKAEDVKCDECGCFTVSYGRGKAKEYRCPNPRCSKYVPPKAKEEDKKDE